MESAEIEVLIDELEQRVERLRALYEQYFMGIEKLEPVIPRKDVDRRLWVLRREQIRNTGLRFKLNMIIQRYNTYQQYWQRILREIDNGTYKRDLRRAAARFGEDALTAAARKRLGKKALRELAEDAAAQPDDSFDVDFEYEEEAPGPSAHVPPNAPAPGRIDADALPGVVSSAPEFGKVNTGLSEPPPGPEALRGYRRPARQLEAKPHFNDGLSSIPPPMDFGVLDDPAPKASAPARPEPPASPVRSAPRVPASPPPEPAPAPRTGLLSALSGPVRRAPPAQAKGVPGTSSSPGTRLPCSPSSAQEPSPKPQPAPGRPAVATGPRLAAAPAAPKPPPPSPPSAPGAQKPPASPGQAQRPDASSPRPVAPARAAMPSKPDITPAPQPPAVDGIPQTRVRQIYESYVQAKRACRESTSTVTETALADMLRNSVQKLRSKHTGKNIDFDVVIKDGKAVLKPVIKS